VTIGKTKIIVIVESKLFNRAADGLALMRNPDISLSILGSSSDSACNRPSFQKRALKILEQVLGVLDSNTESDEILWETTSGTRGGVDRRMTKRMFNVTDSFDNRKEEYLRHDAGHADQGVDTSEANADAPEPRCAHDALAQGLVARLKA
jgi:hypothetical protein